MKKTKSKILFVILIIWMLILLNSTQVSAVLQSNGGASATKDIDGWILAIRGMEAQGGTLGLNEKINSTGLLHTTESGSNGLDCHMEKNTEYGAMVLLSASSYGNPNKIESGHTTTGNSTGVVMNINKEWVAAGAGLKGTKVFRYADARYINNDYGTTAGGKYHIGDAMAQSQWHGDFKSTWLTYMDYSGFLRAYSSNIFSYYGKGTATSDDAKYTKPWASRAVIVIGDGL